MSKITWLWKESESECWPIATRLPANALIELHYIARWGSHYSPRLICNERLSSATRLQMDSYIDFTLNKKKIQLSEDKTPITGTSNIVHTVILIMYFRRINYQPYGCLCLNGRGRQRASALANWPCSYWLWSGDKYLSCGGDPSTLTGLLYHHPSQTLPNCSQ